MLPSPASRYMEGKHCIKCASLDCTCPRDDSEHWAVTAEKTIAGLRAEVALLQKEAAWWAGEGQEDRPEIIEWRRLVEIDIRNRTPEQLSRIREIEHMVHLENAEATELRAEVERLQALVEGTDTMQDEIVTLSARLEEERAEVARLKAEKQNAFDEGWRAHEEVDDGTD